METLNYLGEEWRDIKGYEGFYQVSNYGRIKSLARYLKGKNSSVRLKKEIILNPIINIKTGYCAVELQINKHSHKEYVHRLVAFAFPEICGEWFEGAECNHINENKTDNKAINLEWCTHSYNNKLNSEKIKQKLSKAIVQLSKDGTIIKEWHSASEVENTIGYKRSTIYKVANGNRKTAYGYIWRYK